MTVHSKSNPSSQMLIYTDQQFSWSYNFYKKTVIMQSPSNTDNGN